MKINKIILNLFLLLFLFATSNKCFSQIFLKPSAIHTEAVRVLDFKPGYWAQKGDIVSVTIVKKTTDGSNDGNTSSLRSYNNDIYTQNQIIVDSGNPSFETSSFKNGSDANIGITNVLEEGFIVYPNPFDNEIAIELNVDQNSPLRIDLYNIHGQLIKNIINAKSNSGGLHTYTVNVSDVDQGLYFITARADNFFSSKKVIK